LPRPRAGRQRLTEDALLMLKAHHWRGNVRELENTMHRAVLLSRGEEVGPEAIMLTSKLLAPEGSAQASIPSDSPVANPFAGPGGTVPTAAAQPQQPAAPLVVPPPASLPTSYGPPKGGKPGPYGMPANGGAAAAAAAASANTGSAAGLAALIGRTVADVERDLILETLTHCLGNRTHAANILGISIRTLRNKLKQYGDEGRSVPAPGNDERATA
ncbi:helix-turn-helix domain-containing protein, partial [Azospirillum sp. B506]|uniref:helix-turn-helix domain-containing protein n=1 Tax=Azospirillum sp. B506 TaxID=137721 RepID=UPI0005B2D797